MPDDLMVPAVHLRRDGVSLLLLAQRDQLPAVVHWGADLGPVTEELIAGLAPATERQSDHGTLDAPWRVTVMPLEGDGWHGRPGLQLRRGGELVYPRWSAVRLAEDAGAAVVTATSAGVALEVRLELVEGGLVQGTASVTNTGDDELDVDWLEVCLTVPRRARTLTDFGGRWTHEKVPHARPLSQGSLTRQSRRGKPGHDAIMLTALSPDPPRNRAGEVWGVHLAWSGDQTHRTDTLSELPVLLGAGELLRPGEMALAPGSSYTTPAVLFAHSRDGWDGLSARFHAFQRARHPRPRAPFTLNTWEAVHFDQFPGTLEHLADTAAAVGVERFVVDDGWFLRRRDDTRALGDWVVDPRVWPEGLRPLADRVHAHGMEFGLWFEPEMISLDSDLARAHPDWLLHHQPLASPPGLTWRHQYVLDLARPDAFSHLLETISALVDEIGIDYIKWDHNRELVEAVHAGRPGVHAQTRAAYRLMAALKEAHPGLEIESCSSGGARTDLGVLALADRIWASDATDAITRQRIQRWTQLLVPPEYVGAHVGPSPAHNTGRSLDLPFRSATTLMGSAGVEWNLGACAADELALVQRFAALYREVRPLIASALVVHPDLADPALTATGFVAPDRSEGLWTVATLDELADAMPECLPLHGLDPDALYDVRTVDLGPVLTSAWRPGWIQPDGVRLTGRLLEAVGLQLPTLWPQQALVIRVTRVPHP